MMKKRLTSVFVILLFMGIVFFFSESYVKEDIIFDFYTPENDLIYTKYKTSLELSKVSGGKITTYFPRFKEANLETANIYANFFNIPANFHESEDSFVFSKEDKELIVYKYVNKVEFKNNAFSKEAVENNITHKETIDISKKFFEANLLELNYEEAFIDLEEDLYHITFIGRLGNLKNMGFANNIKINQAGEVVKLEYYYATYERLRSLSIKSMYQAYHELPFDIADDNLIYITSCELVYIYSDSIVQPAYHFKGIVENGTYFESFVKAISFE